MPRLMCRFDGDYLHLELTRKQVGWLHFACRHGRDAASDTGDEQLRAGIETLAGLFKVALDSAMLLDERSEIRQV